MSETKVQRPGFGEDGIYLDAARNRYMGAISLGFGPDGKRIRRKVSGKTRQDRTPKTELGHLGIAGGAGDPVKPSSAATIPMARKIRASQAWSSPFDASSGRQRYLDLQVVDHAHDTVDAAERKTCHHAAKTSVSSRDAGHFLDGVTVRRVSRRARELAVVASQRSRSIRSDPRR